MSEEYVEFKLHAGDREISIKINDITHHVDTYTEAFRDFLLAMTFQEKTVMESFRRLGNSSI